MSIVTLTTKAQSSNLFSNLSDNKDVTTVIISKSLLRMIPNIDANIGVDGVNFKDLASRLDRLEIYTTESKSVVNLMKRETQSLVKDKSYENLMSIKDDGEDINFLIKTSKSEMIGEMIMIVDEPSESTIIRIIGNFTMDDIQGVASGKSDKSKNK